jgi:hypothetical protein
MGRYARVGHNKLLTRLVRVGPLLGTTIPPHDPEKWGPVFARDHAPISRNA